MYRSIRKGGTHYQRIRQDRAWKEAMENPVRAIDAASESSDDDQRADGGQRADGEVVETVNTTSGKLPSIILYIIIDYYARIY